MSTKRSTDGDSTLLQLTPEDVQRLLNPDSGGEARESIATRVASSYTHRRFGPLETAMAEQLFRLLAHDTELVVRAALSEQLKLSKSLPRDIALTMAQDVADIVAVPMLRYSEVLEDADLLNLAETAAAESRHVALSQRREVPEALAGTLMRHGGVETARALAENRGAALDESALKKLMERYGEDKVMMQSIAERPALPLSVAEALISRVSQGVAQSLTKRYNLGAGHLKEETERAREVSTLALLKRDATPFEVQKLVDQLSTFHRLTPSLIFTALCQGHVLFFETALASMASVPLANAQKLINDRGGLGFRAIYNKSGLPSGMFNAIKLVLSQVHEMLPNHATMQGEQFANRLVERLLQVSEAAPVENLSYIIALLRGGRA